MIVNQGSYCLCHDQITGQRSESWGIRKWEPQLWVPGTWHQSRSTSSKWMPLAPTEVGSRHWGLHYTATENWILRIPACYWTQQMRHLCLTCFPNMTFISLSIISTGLLKWKRSANTHGVSSMTLHTLAMVLRQSVVFSIGKFLFCKSVQRTKEWWTAITYEKFKTYHNMKNYQL